MNILIREMDMPNDCSKCFIKVQECDAIEPLKINERPKDCPLIEVQASSFDKRNELKLLKRIKSGKGLLPIIRVLKD